MIKYFAVTVVVSAILISQSACSSELLSTGEVEEEVHQALEEDDFGRAIDLILPTAEAGDPEFQFSVGHLALLWIEAESPKEPPRYDLDEAVSWIRRAAEQGNPQAAGFLRSGYEWGRYGFPKDAELEACWRKVEWNEQSAEICLELERLSGTQS